MVTEQQMIKILEEFLKAWNSHDANQITQFFSENCLYEEGALGVANHGKQQLKSYLEILFHDFPDFSLVMKDNLCNNERAAYEGTWSGTFTNSTMPGMAPATGKKVTIPFGGFVETEKGKISRLSSYWDLVSFLKQAGLMPG
jgi:steroid delta-isomerase-like uncharacterized protein